MEDNEKRGELAQAAAHILAALAASGPKGMAFAAAREAAPYLIKIAAGLIALALLLPMLIFTAMPNTLFGFDSSTTPDIAEFTASAHRLDAAYQNIDQKTQTVVDRLVAGILPDFWTDGAADYDSYTVEKSLGSLNHYWFIAIGSVCYKQDLNAMDGAAVDRLFSAKLAYSASITNRVLNIFVWDLTPEAYMDKLGFTQEEKDWAALLYSVLAEDQKFGPNDTDGTSPGGTDYGSITFTGSATPVVYYNQTDARWGNKLYGRTGTIGWEGCGPTALAIVVASLTENKVTPYDVAQWSVQNGYRCEGNGSYRTLIPNGGAHYGLTVDKVGRDSKKLVEALESGKLVIAIMGPGHFTTTGHFIVLRGITEEGNVLVADPASVKRSNQEWPLSTVINEASASTAAGGPFWAFSR